MRSVAKADYAVCVNPAKDTRPGWDASNATWADLRVLWARQPIVAADVTREELRDISKAAGTVGDIQVLPALDQKPGASDKALRVVMVEDTNRSLARTRQRNLDKIGFVTFTVMDDLEKRLNAR